MALRRMMAEDNAKKNAAAAKSKGGKTTTYTPEQRFFLGFAQIWCLNASPESLRLQDRKSTRLNSSHQIISYAVFCLKKKKKANTNCTITLEDSLLTVPLEYTR